MIFIGDGALLHRAVRHALAEGHPVDLVCSTDPLDAAGAPHLAAPDVNAHADTLAAACTDGIVWSLNNRRIFRAPLLSRGLRILNVHNGLLPQHRGLPSVALLFALLHGDPEYGATLHEVDAGIDTGPVLAERRFPLTPEDRHHQVMLRGIRACQRLFEEHLPYVATGTPAPPAATPRPPAPSAYYGARALARLADFRDHPSYPRATDLGPFAPHAPEVARAVAELR
ncbi:formyltransferase family protein (plasmid) [Streptomyces sp. NBC_00536]|uniref:formyltransferase family protein n=1 Tax=Streptomyces sp. NBC_00536 TaxID=2975769 RepID=UPI002E806EBB|nr:formyltransferase family protein [Streptomyces sp. NBC_00536]WUC84128.1 formyltransferase family protein [Streptomyces sp. NBC_00536]